jgi:hypothetical protein
MNEGDNQKTDLSPYLNREPRWLLVSDGTPQMHYVGKSILSDDEIDELSRRGGYMHLGECRSLRTLVMPGPEGIIIQNHVHPISLCRGAISIKIKPTSYTRLDEDEATMNMTLQLIKRCEEIELAHRVKDAGLVPAGGARVDHEGKLVR